MGGENNLAIKTKRHIEIVNLAAFTAITFEVPFQVQITPTLWGKFLLISLRILASALIASGTAAAATIAGFGDGSAFTINTKGTETNSSITAGSEPKFVFFRKH